MTFYGELMYRKSEGSLGFPPPKPWFIFPRLWNPRTIKPSDYRHTISSALAACINYKCDCLKWRIIHSNNSFVVNNFVVKCIEIIFIHFCGIGPKKRVHLSCECHQSSSSKHCPWVLAVDMLLLVSHSNNNSNLVIGTTAGSSLFYTKFVRLSVWHTCDLWPHLSTDQNNLGVIGKPQNSSFRKISLVQIGLC